MSHILYSSFSVYRHTINFGQKPQEQNLSQHKVGMLTGWAFVLDSLDSSLILYISPLFISALKISFTFLTLVAQFTDKELNVHP